MKIATIKTGLASLAMLPGLVMAAPAVADKADNAFMMICTALVLFMTIPGIALFYGGLIRGKNVLSMLTQVTVTFALVCILWVVYGYSLAFGEGNNFFGNINWLMLKNIELTAVMGSIYQYIHVAFQGSFACITVGLIVGALAETNPLLSCVDFRGGMADALLHSDCAYGVGRWFAGFSRCAGFRGWHRGAH
ncbi:ammonia channel precursor (ammonia transporter) [Escherichia coli]|uniref:Ammonia channel (Ammonia transporter) n=1 Tax=Escherichia coli TaxID=562 RepID=A0A377DWA6_ECOLX|nr:ammonia channel precursor (ammonia transporter) [Escherichia coli]